MLDAEGNHHMLVIHVIMKPMIFLNWIDSLKLFQMLKDVSILFCASTIFVEQEDF